ncbi:hypothetical protein V3C99_014272, partial [Haemonchus contortus]
MFKEALIALCVGFAAANSGPQEALVTKALKPLTLSGNPTSLRQMKAQADDNNEENCVDKQLRADIAEAVKDAEDSCQGLVSALASKLNRPGWAMNCVTRSTGGLSIGFFSRDENFCHFDAVKGGKVYSLTVVKLDKSEPQPEPEE